MIDDGWLWLIPTPHQLFLPSKASCFGLLLKHHRPCYLPFHAKAKKETPKAKGSGAYMNMIFAISE